ncbi:MAG: hypothetical protein J7525_19810 [Roseofilum sp. SID3]|uniref:hypothetical protein n=1 Tax=Roseofilum sp. SID3 TaxID=2821499 RepID=UPI001B1D9B4E|nr:hypothetical protein [Roseofilum sp. SID3]MBP0015343.1 hypothetical protein [Roseofilum sp. SID3]
MANDTKYIVIFYRDETDEAVYDHEIDVIEEAFYGMFGSKAQAIAWADQKIASQQTYQKQPEKP